MSQLYTERLSHYLQQFEENFVRYFPKPKDENDIVRSAMLYACEGGGKRIRPVLLMEFCHLCGGDASMVLPFAAAMEMIHSYSLVHDDLPCMDNSPLRRGKPSVHAVYGETMALLTGDALLNRAFEIMIDRKLAPDIPAEQVIRAAWLLADRSGINGMIGGQELDLKTEGSVIGADQLKTLQEGKTAALLIAACGMGAILGGGTEEQIDGACRFGYYLGLAFQVIDDILDVTATAEELGKPVGSDTQNDKYTYVSLLGQSGAKALAAEYTAEAKQALACFDTGTEALTALADFLLKRTH